MFYVYVLKSMKSSRKYVGFTSKSVFQRLKEHNSGCNKWTRENHPFELLYHEAFADEILARKRERFLKSGTGRKVLARKLIYSPVAQ